MNGNRKMPTGSSAFAQAMSEVVSVPEVTVVDMDNTDKSPDKHSHSHKHDHHEDKGIVHGLHHCYKLEGGHCSTSFRCNHDHARASNGHLEEISKSVTGFSPSPKRRMSIASPGGLGPLMQEEEMFRKRANSDAVGRRRSMALNPSGSPSGGTPEKNSPIVSPAPKRRGSNAVLHSGELHYVYDQYLANKNNKH